MAEKITTNIAPLILLHTGDNILVCIKQIRAGDEIHVEQAAIVVSHGSHFLPCMVSSGRAGFVFSERCTRVYYRHHQCDRWWMEQLI